MVAVSDTVLVTLISAIGTVITALLSAIVAIAVANKNKLEQVHTLVNSQMDDLKKKLVAAIDTITSLRGQLAQAGIVEKKP